MPMLLGRQLPQHVLQNSAVLVVKISCGVSMRILASNVVFFPSAAVATTATVRPLANF